MKAWLALAALAASAPALATSGAPLGKFGDWDLWSSPPGLPPAGEPMPPMGYSASFGDGWSNSWGATARMMFVPEGVLVTTFGGACILRERVSAGGGRSRDPAVLMETLLRQARHVEFCAKGADASPVFQGRMRASMPQLRRMLKRLSEVDRTVRPYPNREEER